MKRVVLSGILTVLLGLSYLPLFAAGSAGAEESRFGVQKPALLLSAVEKTLSEVETRSQNPQAAETTEIKRPPQVIPLPDSGATVPSVMTGSWAVPGPGAAHQEPPFYVNPLSQTIRQVRDLVDGFKGLKQDKEAGGTGQTGTQASGAAAVPAATARQS